MSPTKRARIIPLQTSHILEEQDNYTSQLTPQLPLQQVSFVLLKPLVRQLASIGVPSTSCESDELLDVLNSIVLILQENKIDDLGSARELHGLLIINLGFFLPCEAESIQAADQIVLDLLRCTRILYGSSKCQRLLLPRERMECYFLILKLVNGAFNKDDNKIIYNQVKGTSHKKTVKNECRKILDSFLHQEDFSLSHLLFENRYEIERLILTLFQTAFHTGLREEQKESKLAVVDMLNAVKSRPVFGPKACCLAAIALDILLNTTSASKEKIILDSFSTFDQLFYWKCSLITKQLTSIQSLEILDSIIQQSKSIKSIRIDVLQCLQLLMNQLRIPSEEKIVAEGLLKCAVNDEAGLNLAYMWMSFLIKGQQKDDLQNLQMTMGRLKELKEFLVPYTFPCNGKHASIPAAGKALVHIISLQAERFALFSKAEKEALVSLTSDLLLADMEGTITENAIKIVEFLLTSCSDLQMGISSMYQQLVIAVAEAACNEFTTDRIRGGAVRIIWILAIKNEGIKIEALTRIPKVLEVLVNTASPTEDNSLMERTKALEVLLRLSENVCNQRILAKQPGLLSSLIRYARSVPRESSNVEDATMRNSIKQQIFFLARAL